MNNENIDDKEMFDNPSCLDSLYTSKLLAFCAVKMNNKEVFEEALRINFMNFNKIHAEFDPETVSLLLGLIKNKTNIMIKLTDEERDKFEKWSIEFKDKTFLSSDKPNKVCFETTFSKLLKPDYLEAN